MEIHDLALTGTVLSVFGSGGRVAAWLLTEEGLVEGVFGDRRAGDGDGIWVAWARAGNTMFTVKDHAVVIQEGEHIHAYHTGTGEALDHAQVRPRYPQYSSRLMALCEHYPNYRKANKQGYLPRGDWPVPLVVPQVGWVKDPEGKHQLWIPVEWRTDAGRLPPGLVRIGRHHHMHRQVWPSLTICHAFIVLHSRHSMLYKSPWCMLVYVSDIYRTYGSI